MDKDELLMKQQAEVDSKLWAMANDLRGNMDASEFKNYILGLIFYKFLSDKIVKTINDELKDDNLTLFSAWDDASMRQDIITMSTNVLGYFIDPKYLFATFVKKIDKSEFSVEDLKEGIKALVQSTTNGSSQENETEEEMKAREYRISAFSDLFEDMDLDDNKLGKGEAERSKLIGKIISKINDLNLDISETNFDILGHAYEYLIGKFAASAGKKAGEFYTPAQVSELLARIVTLESKDIKTAYDPTCGSGSLLLRVRNNSSNPNSIKLYGQEMVTTTYNLARMNMLMHGVDYEKFDIYNGDTLAFPPYEKHKNLKVDAVVANPPYSASWDPEGREDDERFNGFDGEYAPKNFADYAFIQHMLFHLNDSGTLAVVLPHGVLFRGKSEAKIRAKLIADYNWLDAIIGLPANLFYGTTIPTCILVFKKCRKDSENILFIDASKSFEKGKNQNYLRDSDIDNILVAFKNRKDCGDYAKLVSVSDIKKSHFDLQVAHYFKKKEQSDEIDAATILERMSTLEDKRDKLSISIANRIKELKNETNN